MSPNYIAYEVEKSGYLSCFEFVKRALKLKKSTMDIGAFFC